MFFVDSNSVCSRLTADELCWRKAFRSVWCSGVRGFWDTIPAVCNSCNSFSDTRVSSLTHQPIPPINDEITSRFTTKVWCNHCMWSPVNLVLQCSDDTISEPLHRFLVGPTTSSTITEHIKAICTFVFRLSCMMIHRRAFLFTLITNELKY